jgi:lysyl-tRNA synthetase, class II
MWKKEEEMAMEFTTVDSTQLDEVGYDEETGTAQVRFQNGALYEYDDVPKSVVDAIISAPSAGQQFNLTLKYGYTYRRLG